VLPHPCHGDALEQLLVLVVAPPLARVLPRARLGRRRYEQPGQRRDGDETDRRASTSRWTSVEHDVSAPRSSWCAPGVPPGKAP
jgi:hypothetical protein